MYDEKKLVAKVGVTPTAKIEGCVQQGNIGMGLGSVPDTVINLAMSIESKALGIGAKLFDDLNVPCDAVGLRSTESINIKLDDAVCLLSRINDVLGTIYDRL
jgi:hypothetical protein